ncbi:hypothetical protein N665_0076s0157 [Sinapis alba]|nr:hypothetical protein N665_0076s0157 [Sinapis alba]
MIFDDESANVSLASQFEAVACYPRRKGCRYYTKDFHGSVEAFNVNPVDTTGAGDSFIGAFLSQIVDDQSLLEEDERLRKVLTAEVLKPSKVYKLASAYRYNE